MLDVDLKKFGIVAGWHALPRGSNALSLADTTSDPAFPGALLPVIGSDGARSWYAVARDGAEWRVLQPLLLAYVGPTVTSFRGQSVVLDVSNPMERLLLDAGSHACARLIPGAECVDLAERALSRLVHALRHRPAGRISTINTTAQLLSRFELCLATGDRNGAERIIGSLRSGLRLDALNLHFLEVRLLSEFRDWSELVRQDWFRDLVRARKPSNVAAALLESLWFTQPEGIAAEDSDFVGPYWTSVRPLVVQLLGQISPGSNPVADQLRGHVGLTLETSKSPGAKAQVCLEEAVEAPSLKRVSVARDSIAGLDRPDQERLRDSAAGRSALQQMGETGIAIPTTWGSWLEALSDPAFKNSSVVARDLVQESPAALIETYEQASNIADQIVSIVVTEGLGHRRLVEAIPTLLLWAKDDPSYPRRAIRPIYDALFQAFSFFESRGHAERDAIADLLDCLLELGLTPTAYRQVLKDLSEMVDPGAGQSTVYWLLDLAAILLQHPTRDADARLAFLNVALESFRGILQLISGGQRAAYNRVAAGAAWPVLPTPVEADPVNPFRSLMGKTVAIYTLTESAGRQAEAALRELEATLDVSLAHDHVASPRLVRLSKTADIFVLAAASAKHAATDCIMANRGGLPLLYAPGRGFSGILRAVEDYAASLDPRQATH